MTRINRDIFLERKTSNFSELEIQAIEKYDNWLDQQSDLLSRHVIPVMTRPNWDEFVAKTSGGFLRCSCMQVLQTFESVREHWQRGHFDYLMSDPDPLR